MNVGAISNREVIFVYKDEPVRRAAELMRYHHVGDVVVVDEDDGVRRPVGIVTDRDIIIKVIAPGIDPAALAVKDVMSDRIIIAFDTDDEYETVQKMHRAGVRRVPVVGRDDGALLGILAVDDLLEHIARELGELAGVANMQRTRESDLRR